MLLNEHNAHAPVEWNLITRLLLSTITSTEKSELTWLMRDRHRCPIIMVSKHNVHKKGQNRMDNGHTKVF